MHTKLDFNTGEIYYYLKKKINILKILYNFYSEQLVFLFLSDNYWSNMDTQGRGMGVDQNIQHKTNTVPRIQNPRNSLCSFSSFSYNPPQRPESLVSSSCLIPV